MKNMKNKTEEAARAYDAAARHIRGPNARTNFQLAPGEVPPPFVLPDPPASRGRGKGGDGPPGDGGPNGGPGGGGGGGGVGAPGGGGGSSRPPHATKKQQRAAGQSAAALAKANANGLPTTMSGLGPGPGPGGGIGGVGGVGGGAGGMNRVGPGGGPGGMSGPGGYGGGVRHGPGPGGYNIGGGSSGMSGIGGLPQRGYTAMPGGIPSVAGTNPTSNDLSALVNANLALAQQNLALAGTHTNPDNGYIRLGLGGPGGGGVGGGGGSGSTMRPPDMPSEIPRIHGSKRERAPSNPFLGTSFGVAGSFGSVFGHDYLSSTPDNNNGMFPMGTSPMGGMGSLGNGMGSLGNGMGMSPESRGGYAKMAEMANKNKLNPALFGSLGARQDDFQVGSLGAMGALDDALPLVGSMDLGSPLESFGDLMSSLPKGSVGKGGGGGGGGDAGGGGSVGSKSQLPIASEANKVQNGNNGAFGQRSRQGGGTMDPGQAATDALSARGPRG